MKDHKGYEQRPLDTQDKVVLWGCALAIVIMLVIEACS